jgi:membrane protein implicated in regulation of membrane protease activity
MEKTYLDLIKLMAFAIPIIFGFVEFIKAAFELSGKLVTWVSFLVGVVFGGATLAAYLFPEYAPYIAGAIFVLASGLVASGFYKFIDNRITPPSG